MFLYDIYKVLIEKGANNAICHKGLYTTYEDLRKKVNGIRLFIQKVIPEDVKGLGLVAYSHPDTYAAIIAFWLEGKYYVPILPISPIERNKSVINEGGLEYMFGKSTFDQFLDIQQYDIDKIDEVNISLPYKEPLNDNIAYLLFTSGSTGKPKGVPIQVGNLNAFVNSMYSLGYEVKEDDRCSQMFELTFDLSVVSYTLPFMVGSCLYLIPDGELKADYMLDLLEEYHLTVLGMVPSVLSYLRKFFDDISEDNTRFCWFCGEALPVSIIHEWSKCIPNSKIVNFYGPTEDTIYCMYYEYNTDNCKVLNGNMSIGKSMPYNGCEVFGENSVPKEIDEEGELCLSGLQLTPGYWNNPEKNKESFFEHDGVRYYKTGDLCYKDADGDIMYLGRKDFQTKIQGFRVELSEIEYYASEAVDYKYSCVCVAYQIGGLAALGLAIETSELDDSAVISYIRKKLPPYEVPSKVVCIPAFPHNTNGKIDRIIIQKYFQ